MDWELCKRLLNVWDSDVANPCQVRRFAWLHEGRGGEKVHEDFWSMALFSASVRDTAEVCGVAQMLSLSLSQPLLPAPCSA